MTVHIQSSTGEQALSHSKVMHINTSFRDPNKSAQNVLHTRQHYTLCLKKNVPPLVCYNFDTHEWILIFFGRNVTDKVGNQKTLYNATTSNNLCFCTTWQNGETRKSHYSLNWTVLHTQCTCALSF